MVYEYIFVSICCILSLIVCIPYLITIIFPKLCFGCTTMGKTYMYLDKMIHIADICWIAFLILFIYLINKIYYTKYISRIVKCLLIFLCISIIYIVLWPLLKIINIFLKLIFNNTAFINNYYTMYPELYNIEANADNIIHEFNEYMNKYSARCIRESNPGFKIETTNSTENCWRAIFLKKVGIIQNEYVSLFPNLYSLLNHEFINTAFFSILDPGVEIPEHKGYYKGYLRYHLGIIIPNNNTLNTNDKSYIVCNNQKYYWKEKEGVLFDDMFLHYVKNPTNKTRVVLYLDIKRTSDNVFINSILKLGFFLIESNPLLNLFIKNQHSQIKIKD